MAEELLAASDEPIQLQGEVASVDITVDTRVAESEAMSGLGRFWEDPESTTRLYLNIEHIDAERDPGIVYGVYLEAPSTSSEERRYLLGTLALFGIEHVHSDEGSDDAAAYRLTFDVTDLARDLEGADLAGQTLRVTFRPLTGDTPEGEPNIDPVEESGAPITIGRVSLFAA